LVPCRLTSKLGKVKTMREISVVTSHFLSLLAQVCLDPKQPHSQAAIVYANKLNAIRFFLATAMHSIIRKLSATTETLAF